MNYEPLYTFAEKHRVPYNELCTALREALAAPQPEPVAPPGWREALQFYADGSHFVMAVQDAWDTVSGEPTNFWCDEAGTATVEDGTVAKMALAGTPLPNEDDDGAAPPAAPDIVNPITPAGMVTVPREPTQEMIAAGEAVFRSYCFRHVNGAIPTYEAMIAAAPAPAVPANKMGQGRLILEAASGMHGDVDKQLTAIYTDWLNSLAAPAVREPLTDEQIDALWRAPMSADWEHREFARAIEAHHGIGGGGNG